MAIRTGDELAKMAVYAATKCKTLYVHGCFGAPMTEANKAYYLTNTDYNRQPERQAMIRAASPDTFGFDCVCLIKGILWGWRGNAALPYGGAAYRSNGVPDLGSNQIITVCRDVSSDFGSPGRLSVGELLWLPGHVGIALGDGLAVECTPDWRNCVQITSVNCARAGYSRRNWVKHGKLPWITYAERSASSVNLLPIAREVIAGQWGNGSERKERLAEAGHNPDAVQRAVNHLLRRESKKGRR